MLYSRLRSWWQRCESWLLFVVVAAVVALIGSWQCTAYREVAYRRGFEAGLSAVVLPTATAPPQVLQGVWADRARVRMDAGGYLVVMGRYE